MTDETTELELDYSDDTPIGPRMVGAMRDIQAVTKDSRVTSGPAKFSFRGVDAVINAVGPILRRHGIFVMPQAGEQTQADYPAGSGKMMTRIFLPVCFEFHAPDGSFVSACVQGEAADSQDKASAKAHSVAYRIALLQVFAIPTDDVDPDAHSHERLSEPEAPPGPSAEEEQSAKDRGWENHGAMQEEWESLREATRDITDGPAKTYMKEWLVEAGASYGGFTPRHAQQWEEFLSNVKKDGEWRKGYDAPAIEVHDDNNEEEGQ